MGTALFLSAVEVVLVIPPYDTLLVLEYFLVENRKLDALPSRNFISRIHLTPCWNIR